jgi:hypothetical protein
MTQHDSVTTSARGEATLVGLTWNLLGRKTKKIHVVDLVVTDG